VGKGGGEGLRGTLKGSAPDPERVGVYVKRFREGSRHVWMGETIVVKQNAAKFHNKAKPRTGKMFEKKWLTPLV